MTDVDFEDRVRQRAYELWEAAGRPEGRGDEFWHDAWEAIATEDEQAPHPATGKSAPLPETLTGNERPKSAKPTT